MANCFELLPTCCTAQRLFASAFLAAVMCGQEIADAVEGSLVSLSANPSITREQPNFEIRGVSFETKRLIAFLKQLQKQAALWLCAAKSVFFFVVGAHFAVGILRKQSSLCMKMHFLILYSFIFIKQRN